MIFCQKKKIRLCTHTQHVCPLLMVVLIVYIRFQWVCTLICKTEINWYHSLESSRNTLVICLLPVHLTVPKAAFLLCAKKKCTSKYVFVFSKDLQVRSEIFLSGLQQQEKCKLPMEWRVHIWNALQDILGSVFFLSLSQPDMIVIRFQQKCFSHRSSVNVNAFPRC